MTDGADDVTTVLAFAPAAQGAPLDGCARALDRGGRLDRAVAVTITESASSWLDSWDQYGPEIPVTCVDVAADARSLAHDGGIDRSDVTLKHVSDPSNLERVGRTVSDVLQQADDADERVGLVVHSLTDLLEQFDESTAFKFVYTLGEVVRRVDGIACFTIDPGAHDSETIDTFSIACDTTAELDRDLAACDSCE